MISFKLLTKDDLRELIEGFDIQFLQQPFKRPMTSLKRYIPNGFRPNKLPRGQMVKTFCEAIMDREPSISKYVQKEIESQFNKTGITEYIDNLGRPNEISEGAINLSVGILSVRICTSHLVIPAHIALMLYEIKCSEAAVKLSRELVETYSREIEKAKNIGYTEGMEKASALFQLEIEDEARKCNKLHKSVDSIQKKNDELNGNYANVCSARDEALTQISILNESVFQEKEKNTFLNKQVTLLKNDLLGKAGIITNLKEEITHLKKEIERISELEYQNAELNSKLHEAEKIAYSEDVLKKLSTDALDELKATSLSEKEILSIAKKQFAESDSIEAAWNKISSDSIEHIKIVLAAFSVGEFEETYLDDIEKVEDGVLIKYTVLKSLKSILYNELEKKESNKNISDEFSASRVSF